MRQRGKTMTASSKYDIEVYFIIKIKRHNIMISLFYTNI